MLQQAFISDGTEAGTRHIKDINQQLVFEGAPFNAPSSPYTMAVLNGKAIFAADDGLVASYGSVMAPRQAHSS